MHPGWYQIAYERELTAALTPLSIGDHRLVIVKTADGVLAYEGRCPHRGMELGRGGVLCPNAIVCPFHGRRIGLGTPGDDGYEIRPFRTLVVGGLVFVLMAEKHENGLTVRLNALDKGYFFVPGFTIPARISPEVVVENAFDTRHFKHVHGLMAVPQAELTQGPMGGLVVRSRLCAPHRNPWQQAPGGEVVTEMVAEVFSPTVCLTELRDGGRHYLVLTAATPTSVGECVIRVSLVVPAEARGEAPDQEEVRALMRDSRAAIEQDLAIWQHLPPGACGRLAPEDDLLRSFHQFCREFGTTSGA